jgi:hypothetical protein
MHPLLLRSFIAGPLNNPTPQQDIVLIKYGSLPRGNSELGRGKRDLYLVRIRGNDPAIHSGRLVTDLHLGLHGCRRRGNTHPVQAVNVAARR